MNLYLTKTFTTFLICLFSVISFSQSYYEYNFTNDFSETNASIPDLNPICAGNFINDRISSCIQKGVYHFDFNCGLSFDNTSANNFISDEYTIEMYFKFRTLNSWKRIIDYKNRSSDFGLYGLNGRVNFYNLTTSSEAPFFVDTYAHILVTRQASSDEYKVYVDGIEYISFIDSDQHGVLSEENILTFFHDDLIVQNEASEGEVSLIRIYDYVLTPSKVLNSFNDLPVIAVDAEICSGDTLDGYSSNGIYRDTFSSSIMGCDSIRILNLTVYNKLEIFDTDATICEGENFEGFTNTGIYTNTFTNQQGCDSIRTIDLTVLRTQSATYSILNMAGQVVVAPESLPTSHIVDVAHLVAGVYYLKIDTIEGTYYGKLVK